jgi:hypothetical protein
MEKRKSQGKGPKQGLSSERLEACFQFLCSLAISPCGLSLVPFIFFFLVFLFIFNLMGLVFLALRHFWALWSFLKKKKKKMLFFVFWEKGFVWFLLSALHYC